MVHTSHTTHVLYRISFASMRAQARGGSTINMLYTAHIRDGQTHSRFLSHMFTHSAAPHMRRMAAESSEYLRKARLQKLTISPPGEDGEVTMARLGCRIRRGKDGEARMDGLVRRGWRGEDGEARNHRGEDGEERMVRAEGEDGKVRQGWRGE